MKIGNKIFIMIFSIIILTIGALGVYAFNIVNDAEKIMSTSFDDLGFMDNSIDFNASEPFSILLMGIDTGGEGRKDPWDGRSDSMMVATINPKTKSTTIVSLERDMLTNIVDTDGKPTGEFKKLNDAYADGGAKLSIANISKLLDIDLNAYALINMEGLVTLVDAVGGITVNNTTGDTISIEETEPDYKATIKQGEQHINGDQALVYSRMRHQDPEGDIGRQTRQREVITQLLNKLLSVDSLTKYQKILKAVDGNVKTNVKITASTVTSLMNYSDSFSKIKTIKVQGVGEMINNISYQVMPANNLLSIQNAMKRSLSEEDEKYQLSQDIVTYESYYGSSPKDYEKPIITVVESDKAAVEYGLDTDGKEIDLKDREESKESSSSQESNSMTTNDDYTTDNSYTYGDNYSNEEYPN